MQTPSDLLVGRLRLKLNARQRTKEGETILATTVKGDKNDYLLTCRLKSKLSPDMDGDCTVIQKHITGVDAERGKTRKKSVTFSSKHFECDSVAKKVSSDAISSCEVHPAKIPESYYGNLVATRPTECFAFLIVLCVLMISLTIWFGVIFSTKPVFDPNLSLQLPYSPEFKCSSAWKLILSDLDISHFYFDHIKFYKINIKHLIRMLTDVMHKNHFVDIVLELKSGGNVLTKHNLNMLKRLEKRILTELKCLKRCYVTIYSILRLFDGSFERIDTRLRDTYFNQVFTVINASYDHLVTKYLVSHLLSKDIKTTNRIVTATKTRILFEVKENFTANNFQKYRIFDLLDKLSAKGHERYLVYIKNPLLKLYKLVKALKFTGLLVIGSVLSHVIVLAAALPSLWFVLWAVLIPLFSVVLGYLTYAVGMKYQHIGIYHMVFTSIFVLKSVNEISIISLLCKSLQKKEYVTSAAQASIIFYRIVRQITIPTFISIGCFVLILISPVFTQKSLGLFAVISVTFYFVLVIVFLPAVSYIYSVIIKKSSISPKIVEIYRGKNCDVSIMTIFLSTTYLKLLSNTIFFAISFLLWITITIVSVAILTINLKIENRAVTFLSVNDKMEQYGEKILEGFSPSVLRPETNMYIVWGVSCNLEEHCAFKRQEYSCNVTHNFDQSTNLSSIVAQKDLLAFCKYLKNLDQERMDSLRIRIHPIQNRREIYCYLTNVKLTHLHYYLNLYKQKKIDNFTFHKLIGIYKEKTNESSRIRYVAIRVVLSLDPYTEPYPSGLKLYREWDKLIKTKMSKLSNDMKKGFQTTYEAWHWFLVSESVLFYSLVASAGGLGIVLLCMALSSSVILALLVTINLTTLAVNTLGICCLLTWKVGVIEAINLSLAVVLAADNPVHMCLGYWLSNCHLRKDRVQDILGDIAPAILTGGLNAIISSVFMIFSPVHIISTMGIIIALVSTLSLFYSLVLIPVFLCQIGPQTSTNYASSLINKLFNKKRSELNDTQ